MFSFDNLDQDILVEMLSRRIGDRELLRLIRKWLKAGVLDTDGKVTHPLTGTPQGGIISPILANVYLHHVLDLWFHEVVKMHTTGEACLIRYADDFVCAFQNQDEAQHFYGALEHRLSKFGLQLAAAKSRVIPFSRNGEPGATRFDFLGFEFHWGKDRAGKPHLKRRTSRKKLRNSLANFTQWCKQSRHTPMKKLFASLNLKLRGYYNYYGVSGNSDRLKEFFNEGLRTLWNWLNRRSQHRSYTRSGFDDCSIISMCRGHRSFGGAVPDYSAGFSLPAPDAETSISAEPGARKGHAGICAGAVRATGRPTAMVPEQHHWRAMVRCHRGI